MPHTYSGMIKKYAKLAFVFTVHVALIALFLTGFWLIEVLVHKYWGDIADPKFFGVIPLKYPFQAIDLVIIAMFGYRGSLEINEVLKDESHD